MPGVKYSGCWKYILITPHAFTIVLQAIPQRQNYSQPVFMGNWTVHGCYACCSVVLVRLTALLSAHAAVMDVTAFERLLGPCMDIMKRNISNYETQLASILASTDRTISAPSDTTMVWVQPMVELGSEKWSGYVLMSRPHVDVCWMSLLFVCLPPTVSLCSEWSLLQELMKGDFVCCRSWGQVLDNVPTLSRP